MTTRKKPFNPFWVLLSVSATLFCISALAWIAAGFSQTASPLTQFMNARGATLIVAEAAITMVLGLFALIVDSRQSRRDRQPP
jgi:hypothetical protein